MSFRNFLRSYPFESMFPIDDDEFHWIYPPYELSYYPVQLMDRPSRFMVQELKFAHKATCMDQPLLKYFQEKIKPELKCSTGELVFNLPYKGYNHRQVLYHHLSRLEYQGSYYCGRVETRAPKLMLHQKVTNAPSTIIFGSYQTLAEFRRMTLELRGPNREVSVRYHERLSCTDNRLLEHHRPNKAISRYPLRLYWPSLPLNGDHYFAYMVMGRTESVYGHYSILNDTAIRVRPYSKRPDPDSSTVMDRFFHAHEPIFRYIDWYDPWIHPTAADCCTELSDYGSHFQPKLSLIGYVNGKIEGQVHYQRHMRFDVDQGDGYTIQEIKILPNETRYLVNKFFAGPKQLCLGDLRMPNKISNPASVVQFEMNDTHALYPGMSVVPELNMVVASSPDSLVRFWDLNTGKLVYVWQQHNLIERYKENSDVFTWCKVGSSNRTQPVDTQVLYAHNFAFHDSNEPTSYEPEDVLFIWKNNILYFYTVDHLKQLIDLPPQMDLDAPD